MVCREFRQVDACRKAPPEDPPESAAFLKITDGKSDPPVTAFSGWMFAESPSLSTLADLTVPFYMCPRHVQRNVALALTLDRIDDLMRTTPSHRGLSSAELARTVDVSGGGYLKLVDD